jgi:hypothetical protein
MIVVPANVFENHLVAWLSTPWPNDRATVTIMPSSRASRATVDTVKLLRRT